MLPRRSNANRMASPMLALLLPAALAACAGQSETPSPATSVLIERLPVVENSTASPCWQQRQIAKQRSYVATVTSGRDQVFAAPCDVDRKTPPKPPAAPAAEVKTS